MQNASGGYSSYETLRGGTILELLNPSEVFGKFGKNEINVMIQCVSYLQETSWLTIAM